MITAEMRAAMRRLVLVEGFKIETVARRFGVHHSTVRRALRDDGQLERSPAPSALDPYKPYIVKRLVDLPDLTSVRLLFELRDRGYARSSLPLHRYVAKVRRPRMRKEYLRVEVDPGEQAQVDWGSFGHIRIGGTQRPLSCFAMVLSWSRALFIDFSLDQRMDTFLRMHRRALEFFGGVPKKILYDNLIRRILHPTKRIATVEEVRKLSARTSRRFRLLRAHGLILKVQRCHRYRLTPRGHLLTAALFAARSATLKQLVAKAA